MNESEEMYIDKPIAQRRYYEAGKEYLALGEYDKAKECFDESPDEVETYDWVDLGNKFLEAKEYDKGKECFEQLHLGTESLVELGELLLEKFLENNDYDKVKEYFKQGYFELEVDTLKRLGELFLKNGDYYEAKECFEQVDSLERAILISVNNDYSKIKEILEMPSVIDVDNWKLLAERFFDNDDYCNALKCFEKLKYSKEEIVKKFLSKDENIEYISNFDEIIETLINKTNSTYIKAKFNLILGKAYYINESYEKAEELFIKCIKLPKKLLDNEQKVDLNLANINLADIYLEQANTYSQQGKFKKSEEYCIKALEICYTNEKVFKEILKLYKNKIELFNESSIIETIKKIPYNKGYNKYDFCISLKDFISDLKKCFESKKIQYSKEFYALFKEYLNIDYNSIYLKLQNIKDEKIIKLVIDIYIICEQILKEQEFTLEDNTQLGHYTTKSGAMAILKKDAKIRLKNSIYANDPQEGEFLKKLIISNESKKFEDSESIDLKKYNNKNVYFFCFSTNIDGDASLPMWVHYADKTEGCILVFDNEFLGDSNIISSEIKTGLSTSKLYKVVYLEKDDTNKIKGLDIQIKDKDKKKIIDLLIRLKNKIKKVEYLKSKKDEDYNIARDIIDEIIEYTSFIFKESHFSYEQEVRLLKRVDDMSKVKIIK